MYRNDLESQMGEITGLLRGLGMEVCNFIPAQFRYPSSLCSANEKVRRDSVAYIMTAMDNAVKVGSPSVSLCPGMALFDRELENGWKQLIRSFQEIEEYNADMRLLLLIEPAHRFESNLILTVEDGLRMIDELGSDSFGILLDTGHAHINGEDLAECITSCHGLPLHIHLDDNDGSFDSHLIPGKGNIDFVTLFEALKSSAYNGFVSVELGGAYCLDPSNACRESLSYLRSL